MKSGIDRGRGALLSLFAASISAALAACGAGEEGEIGTAQEAQSGAFCITNVRTDPTTVHFTGQEWLLGSSEGYGPRTLTVAVAASVLPQVSTSTTTKPSAADVSKAVGYAVQTRIDVAASSTWTVSSGVFQREEAYAAYQRAFWEIRDAACGVLLGTGISYRPIGVFFQTVNTADIPIVDPGVFAFAPGCDGDGCPPGAVAQNPPAGGGTAGPGFLAPNGVSGAVPIGASVAGGLSAGGAAAAGAVLGGSSRDGGT
jgi:hypothetical protein